MFITEQLNGEWLEEMRALEVSIVEQGSETSHTSKKFDPDPKFTEHATIYNFLLIRLAIWEGAAAQALTESPNKALEKSFA